MRSRRAIPATVAALAYALALVQRPGEVVADTKVNLYLEPGRFLRDVLSLWSPTTDLGHVWAGQYSGYAWPMAPWFAAGHALGLPEWLVHRLWLGTLLALAGWGVIRLLDALWDPRRGAVHAAAAVLFVVNPYVTVYAARQSIALLAYASLPWLMICVHRGLRDPRGWLSPACFALVLTSAGGGVNAGLTAWVLLGPALLVVYDRLVGGVGPGALRPFLVRLVPVTVVASLWWVVPLWLSSRAAPNFLAFTEQPGTIWGTTSLTESLRLMGFWTSYVGQGFSGHLKPYQGSAPALVLLLPVVLAGLAIPAAALSALPWTRRWRYAPFFALLLLVGLVVMGAGWPEGTPARRVVTGVYYHVPTVQFLRTTYKAGALTALGIAGLGGAAFGLAWQRAPRVVVGVAGAAVVALASWPLVTGRAVERQLSFDLPASYRVVAHDLDARGDRSRAMVLPGQLFAAYGWGGTVDPVLPALTKRPVTERWIVPFSDLRAADVQFAVDDLITQERLRPGQLRPLLDLLGVGDVVVRADGDRAASGEMPAADAARELRGLGAGRAYGPTVRARAAAGDVSGAVREPELRRVVVPTGGIVRVLPRGPETVVDGAAGALAGLAAYGALDPGRPLAYAPDLGAGGVRAAARAGAGFVISDTNRRRAYVAARSRGQAGATLTAGDDVSSDGNVLDPFGRDGGAARETVAVYRGGVRDVTAPASPQVTQFPDQRPFAALDGDPATAWIADRMLVPVRPTLTVDFDRPRDVAAIDLMPYSDSRGRVRAVDVGGKRFRVHAGWNHLVLGLRGVRSLAVHLADVTRPRDGTAGAGGIRELRIPGVRAAELLRPPTAIEDALRGTDLSHNPLTYILERTTADEPFREGRYAGERSAGELRDAQDPERALARVIDPPAARAWHVEGWATIDPRTPDATIDRLVGGLGTRRVRALDSSSRFDGLGRYRASGAFDGAGGRAWIGQWIAGRPAWIAWSLARPVTVRSLTLDPPGVRVRRPTEVALTADGERIGGLRVDEAGNVALPHPVRGARFRIDIVRAAFPSGTPERARQRRAVGIGEIRGGGVPVVQAPRRGSVALPCGSAVLSTDAGAPIALRGLADRASLDAGRPLRMTACGGPVRLPARPIVLRGSDAPTGALRLDSVRLTAPGPAGGVPTVGGGRVLSGGDQHPSSRDGVRVAATGPSWLVLGESYDRYWRASCDGHGLGEPRPLQGYANAWPIDAGCHAVTFTYALQRVSDVAGAVSVLACLALLGLLGIVARRRRPAVVPLPPPAPLPEPPPVRPLPLTHAVAIAFPIAIALGIGFGLRAGAVGGPLLTLVLWRGIGDRMLGYATAVLLGLAVPLVYVIVGLHQGDHHLRGNATKFPLDRIAAHWLALAALTCVAVVAWRSVAPVRTREPARALPSRR